MPTKRTREDTSRSPIFEPGDYAIEVERAGFILESSGSAGAPGLTVKIDAGQPPNDLTLRVAPLSVIAGQIADADGEPARGAKVDALHYVYANGKKQLRLVAEVEAGDRGNFRLFGLRAGTYYVKATGLQLGPFKLPDKGKATYYPGVTDLSRGSPIKLGAGEQMSGVEIQLQSSGAYRVCFQLSAGSAVSPARSYLFNSDGFFPTENWGSGNEACWGNVPSGSYETIFTGMEADKGASYARRHIEVRNADVDCGAIELVPGATVTGAVRVEGGSVPDLAAISIHLQSDLLNQTRFNLNTGVHSDGSFTFKGVAPLVYSLSLNRAAGLYLKSVRVGERPLAQPRIDAAEKLEPLTIVVGSDTGELDGVVENSKGDPVARARVDAIAPDRPDFNRSAFSDETGHYRITSLPTGAYKIFAWENVPDGAPQDPDFRKPFDKQSASASIEASGRTNLKITAISATEVDRYLQ